MTERFKVHVTSDDAVGAAKKLDAENIPHVGPSFAEFVGAEGGWTAGEDLTAAVDAVDAAAARNEVARVVGRAGDVVATEPY
jgi:predicted dienelactone hydrolase